jgi:hypothetical protein
MGTPEEHAEGPDMYETGEPAAKVVTENEAGLDDREPAKETKPVTDPKTANVVLIGGRFKSKSSLVKSLVELSERTGQSLKGVDLTADADTLFKRYHEMEVQFSKGQVTPAEEQHSEEEEDEGTQEETDEDNPLELMKRLQELKESLAAPKPAEEPPKPEEDEISPEMLKRLEAKGFKVTPPGVQQDLVEQIPELDLAAFETPEMLDLLGDHPAQYMMIMLRAELDRQAKILGLGLKGAFNDVLGRVDKVTATANEVHSQVSYDRRARAFAKAHPDFADLEDEIAETYKKFPVLAEQPDGLDKAYQLVKLEKQINARQKPSKEGLRVPGSAGSQRTTGGTFEQEYAEELFK